MGASETIAVVFVDSDSFWMGYCFVKVVHVLRPQQQEGDRPQRVGELELEAAWTVGGAGNDVEMTFLSLLSSFSLVVSGIPLRLYVLFSIRSLGAFALAVSSISTQRLGVLVED